MKLIKNDVDMRIRNLIYKLKHCDKLEEALKIAYRNNLLDVLRGGTSIGKEYIYEARKETLKNKNCNF